MVIELLTLYRHCILHNHLTLMYIIKNDWHFNSKKDVPTECFDNAIWLFHKRKDYQINFQRGIK